ncbi:MAG: ABC transporter permease [Waltera sp.]
MIKTTAQKIYLGLIFIFLYAPIVTLIVLSFNASKTRAKWGGFTTKWYAALFQNEQIMQALWNTLALAVLSALIATFIGTIASYCHAIHEAYQPYDPYGNHKYSHAERRDCYRYLPDASVLKPWSQIWFWYDSAVTHYV